MAAMKQKTKWVRVTRSARCPVCDSDHWCTVSESGALVKCMDVESAIPVKSGGWLHELSEPVEVRRKADKPEPTPILDWGAKAEECFQRDGSAEARAELAARLGVSVESLEMLGVGTGYDREPFWTFPERNSRRVVTGIVRRYRSGKKLSMKGGHSGLYIVPEWWKRRGPLLVVEGGSDTAALLTMGLCAIGRPSNVGGVNMLIPLVRDSNRPVIVIGEHDLKPERVGTRHQCPANCEGCSWCWPGKYGARHTAEALLRATKRRVSWRMCPDGAKDSREWLNKFGADGGRFLSQLTAMGK